jgi:hypothetical protein
MARTRKALPAQVDVAHLISAGVLASVCPRALVEEVLAETGKASQRERLLPAPAQCRADRARGGVRVGGRSQADEGQLSLGNQHPGSRTSARPRVGKLTQKREPN